MSLRSRFLRYLVCCLLFGVVWGQDQKNSGFPYPEKMSFRVEWRLIMAGTATVEMSHSNPDDWQTKLNLESAGLVARWYKVLDSYRVSTDDKFCAADSYLDAQEGKRHTITRLTFEKAQRKVQYDQRDLVKDATAKKQLEIAPCTHDIVGALEALRESNLQSGKWAAFPMTDGKKMAFVKVEGQAKEPVALPGKTYQTIRYEAFLFDNVLYKRKGRLLIWISDDSDRIPVQMRLQLGFPIGTVTVQLESDKKG